MRISCPQCSETYRVKESMIPLEGVKTRCRSCDIVFQINPREVVDLDTLTGEEDQPLPAATPVEVKAEPQPQPVVEPKPTAEAKPQPSVATAAPPTEELVGDDESEESIVDRIKTQLKDLEVEQAALVLAPVFILALSLSLIQMDYPGISIAPAPYIEEAGDAEEEVAIEDDFSEQLDVAPQEVAEPESEIESEPVQSEESPAEIVDEAEIAVVPEQEQEQSEVEAAVETADTAPAEESVEATTQEVVSGESSAPDAGVSPYSVQRFKSLMEQLEGGVPADALESVVDIQTATPAPSTSATVEPAKPVETTQVETTTAVATEQSETDNVQQLAADTTTIESGSRPATSTTTDSSLYSVKRFTQLMNQLNEGGDMESMTVNTSEPTAAEEHQASSEPVSEPATSGSSSNSSSTLYSVKRFTTLMKQLDGGEIPEQSGEATEQQTAAEPVSEPPAPAEVKEPEVIAEAEIVSETVSTVETDTSSESVAPSNLYGVDRFKSLMDQLERGEEIN